MLKEKISQAYKDAFRGKKELETSALRMLQAAIKNKELEKRAKLAKTEKPEDLEKLQQLLDEEIIAVVSSEIKKRTDAVADYQKGGRADLAEKESLEAKILSQFMPVQFSSDEVRLAVKKIIAEVKPAGPKDFGQVMGRVMAELKGKAPGNLVTEIVKDEMK